MRPVPLALTLAIAGCAPETPLAPSDPAVPNDITPYAPTFDGDTLRVANPANQLDVRFDAAGAHVVRGTSGVTVSLEAWGREGAIRGASPAEPAEGACARSGAVDAAGDCVRQVELDREGLAEWWENDPRGLEHGFTVEERPEGEGMLMFAVRVDGAEVEIDADGDGATFTTGDGRLGYRGLAAWDETGRALPAWMEAREGGLWLVVDDDGAVGAITVDPTISVSDWSVTGSKAWNAGDVNGDGYADVLIGNSSGTTVYLRLGSASGIGTSTVWSLAASSGVGIGDVDCDGYSDIGLISGAGLTVQYGTSTGIDTVKGADFVAGALRVAPGGDINGLDCADVLYQTSGATSIRYGTSAGMATSADWTGPAGTSAVGVGDFDGNGTDDFVIADYNYGSDARGRITLYTDAGSTDVSVEGVSDVFAGVSDQFGYLVAGIGDVNGDLYPDFAVTSTSQPTLVGKRRIFFGNGAGTLSSPLNFDSTSARWVYAIGSAGDFNGDGYGDIVSCDSVDGMRVTLGASSGFSMTGSSYAIGFACTGGAVGAGDIDADGFGDVVAAASTTLRGIHGLPFAPDTSALITSASASSGSRRGWSSAVVGDVNADGLEDLLVGEPGYNGGRGRATLVLGAANGATGSSVTIAPTMNANAAFGTSVAAAGDTNGDGYDDIIIGAPYRTNGQTNEGAAYVYRGTSTGIDTVSNIVTLEGNVASINQGTSVSGAIDINADGYDDVLVGVPGLCLSGVCSGAMRYYYGTPTGVNTTATTRWGSQGGELAGYSVAGVGDVNGDGYDDAIAGAPWYDTAAAPEHGRFAFYRGSATGLVYDWSSEVVPTGEDNVRAGLSVAAAGDVNGDGLADFVVGVIGNAATEGRAAVYLGRSSWTSGVAWAVDTTLAAPEYGTAFGSAVSSAGDVNSDGYGDLIVGAPLYDGAYTDQGAAYVYAGAGTGIGTTAIWSATGGSADNWFGGSVSAGDYDGDGFDDLLVGRPHQTSTYNGAYSLYQGNSPTGAANRSVRVFATHGVTERVAPGHRAWNWVLGSTANSAAGPWGSACVGLDLEVEEYGDAYTPSMAVQGPCTPIGVTPDAVYGGVASLGDDLAYSWRARLRVDGRHATTQLTGPWIYGGRPGAAYGEHAFSDPYPAP